MSMDHVAGERERLRSMFDRAADRYQQARPDYPDQLFGDLLHLAGLRPGDRLLEIGCGTGKATTPLARRGFRITCLEPGARLAAAATANLAAYPDVTVINAPFEPWQRPPGTRFDLVFAATAWHWLDPAIRYWKGWESLRDDGHLAFWSATHVFPDDGDQFFREIQPVYDEIGEGQPSDATWPRPGELPDDRAEILSTGLFDDVQVRHYDWEVQYDAESYLDLLDTFSGHIAMAPGKREHLYSAIRSRLARRPGGHLRRHWGAVLHIAHRSAAN